VGGSENWKIHRENNKLKEIKCGYVELLVDFQVI